MIHDSVKAIHIPESGLPSEMIEKRKELKGDHWRVAYWWQPSNDDMLYRGIGNHYVSYAPSISRFLCASYHYPQDGPVQFGVRLTKPFRKYENKDCRYGSPAITEKFIDDNAFILVIFDGDLFKNEKAIEKSYYRSKQSEIIGRMLENSKMPHFKKLFQGNLREHEGDLKTATDAFLEEASKWCNLDIKILEDLYKASGLYDSSLEFTDENGKTPLSRKLREALLSRRINHQNEVPGYLQLRYELRMNLVTGRPELFDNTEKTFLPMEDSILNSIY